MVADCQNYYYLWGMEYNECDRYVQRKVHRLGGREYCGGHYFVTACTLNHKHHFGRIVDDEMHLSELGKILHKHLTELPQRYTDVAVPVFVIMPNHIHCIIEIAIGHLHLDESVAAFTHSGMQRSRLAVVVGEIKSRLSKQAKSMSYPFSWQRGYYDRVIRDRDEWTLIAQYITTNPQNWTTDTLRHPQ